MILAPIQTLVAEIPPIDPRSVRSGSVGGIGVQLVPPTRRGLLNRSGFPLLILLIIAMCSSAWGACTPYNNYSWTSGGTYNDCMNDKPSNVICSGMKALTYNCQSAGTTCS